MITTVPLCDNYFLVLYMEKFGGGKLANRELFIKIFLANIHRYTKIVFGICNDFSLFANFFLANSFYLYGSPKSSPTKFFLCMVIIIQSKQLSSCEQITKVNIHQYQLKC